ncbi:4'-phosphopantetheinyl transferase [Alkaliphilus peptidifermentans DSM 18978]|uniref:4'-phosphopantetheinyl transferase n=2 Tax=Alkaliphilus TaxID=114627 RepID=A0A1G5I2B2_9FIRM|nr:4'-phosphopantetheinyl transferase superfamily protein [Alkaliphilus peptidifermentans]SCY70163.1 4'-phosphopantetheinyl transferase [Alkaliphilus peptidifermentans DSM 18978]
MKKLKLRNSDIYLESNKYGKPYLLNNENFQFSISHSGIWVACAISPKAIGVDVEEIKSIEDNIARRFFSPQEVKDMFSFTGNERLLYFYDLWTLKESFVKAEGEGLAIPLNSFTVRRNNKGNFYLNKQHAKYFFQQLKISNNYKLSVCCTKGTHFSGIKIYNIDQLYKDFMNKVD